MIVLELVDHLGRIKELHKFGAERIHVGRGYDNDLILNDPFVCAHHIEIEGMPDGTLTVHDLDSLNGLYAYGSKSKVVSLKLASGERMRIGHSILRYRSEEQPVAATREDRLTTDLVNNLLNSSAIMWLGFALLALFVSLASHLGSYSEFKAVQVFRSDLLPYLFALLMWAGFWSLLSRITTHSFYFNAHSIIATATLFFSLLYEEFIDPLLRFSFHLDSSVDRLSYLFSLLLMAIALYAHLRFCSTQSTKRLAVYAIILASSIIGISYMQSYEEADSFSSYPAYHDVILPPAFQLVGERSLNEFFAEVDKLDEKLESQVEMGDAE